MEENFLVKAFSENDFRLEEVNTCEQQDGFLQNQLNHFLTHSDFIKNKNMKVAQKDENISVKKVLNTNSEQDQDVFLEEQLKEFLDNELVDIVSDYSQNVKEKGKNNISDKILEIYNIIEDSQISITEEDILNFLQIENRWPYQYFLDTQNPRQGPSSIYGLDTPIQVIVRENIVETDSFYNRTGRFLFDEWRKYYELGFTTMISDVLDLTPELRKLRSDIFKITGINVEGNFYLTNGGKKVQSSWLPHKHHYNVIVKIIYGDVKWKISDDVLNYSEGDVILIPSETEHSVVECPNKRLSLTINLF